MIFIPIELIDQILEGALSLVDPVKESYGGKGDREYLSFALVCKAWTPSVRRLFFSTVILHPRDTTSLARPSVLAFLRACEQQEWLPPIIQHLVLRIGYMWHDAIPDRLKGLTELRDYAPKLSNLQRVQLHGNSTSHHKVFFELLSPNFYNIPSLHFKDLVERLPISDLAQYIQTFQSLRELKLEHVGLMGSVPGRNQLVHLKRFISSDIITYLPSLFSLISTMPCLEYLQLELTIHKDRLGDIELSFKEYEFTLSQLDTLKLHFTSLDYPVTSLSLLDQAPRIHDLFSRARCPNLRTLHLHGIGWDITSFSLVSPSLTSLHLRMTPGSVFISPRDLKNAILAKKLFPALDSLVLTMEIDKRRTLEKSVLEGLADEEWDVQLKADREWRMCALQVKQLSQGTARTSLPFQQHDAVFPFIGSEEE